MPNLNPSVGDALSNIQTGSSNINQTNLRLAGLESGLAAAKGLGGFAGGGGLNLGLANIMQLIGSQGQLDPRALNLRLADIASTGQNQTDSTRGELAAAGLQGSGVGQALLQAQKGATGAARTREIANEQTAARQRQAQELQGLLFPIIQMIIQQQQIERGGDATQMFDQQQKTQRQGALLGAFGSLGGGLLSGGLLGGG